MLKGYLYFYIAILKCYLFNTSRGNVILSLVVTPRHDKKIAMPIYGFIQKYSSGQHQQRFIEIEYICQYV